MILLNQYVDIVVSPQALLLQFLLALERTIMNNKGYKRFYVVAIALLILAVAATIAAYQSAAIDTVAVIVVGIPVLIAIGLVAAMGRAIQCEKKVVPTAPTPNDPAGYRY